MLLQLRPVASAPPQRHADVARSSPGEIDNLEADLVPARLKMLFPKVVKFLRQAGERLFPAGLALIDGASAIGAQLVGEASDLDFGQAIVGSALDDCRGASHALLIGHARRLREFF